MSWRTSSFVTSSLVAQNGNMFFAEIASYMFARAASRFDGALAGASDM